MKETNTAKDITAMSGYLTVDERRAMLEGRGRLDIYAIAKSEEFDRLTDIYAVWCREHSPHTIELSGGIGKELIVRYADPNIEVNKMPETNKEHISKQIASMHESAEKVFGSMRSIDEDMASIKSDLDEIARGVELLKSRVEMM